MGWRGDRGRGRGSLAARRLTALSPRAPGRALPGRKTDCREGAGGEGPARFNPPAPEKAEGLLEGFCPEPQPEEQVAVNSNGRLLLLRLADIDWLEATDNCVALHVGTETHPLEDTLGAVMAKLPPGRFLRISPSALVNVGQIKDLRPMCQSEWRVLLRNGTRLTLTRGYGEHLRQTGWFLAAPLKSLVCSPFRTGRPAGR
jgi:hypothetical protein